VEEGQVREQAELGGQVPGDVGAVEVDAGHGGDFRVVQGLCFAYTGSVCFF
jgi:hypothetical protein